MRAYRHYLWAGFCACLYLAFILWYGGSGAPLTPAEADALIAQIRQANAQSPERFRHPEFAANIANLAAHDDGGEFFMINLERHDHSPEGEAADRAYTKAVLPALLRHGGFPVYVGTPLGNLVGQMPDGIDRVALVRYRSLRDLLAMNTDPGMVRGIPAKFKSLISTAAFPTAPIFTALTVRLAAGLLMGLLGLAGWIAIRPRRTS